MIRATTGTDSSVEVELIREPLNQYCVEVVACLQAIRKTLPEDTFNRLLQMAVDGTSALIQLEESEIDEKCSYRA